MKLLKGVTSSILIFLLCIVAPFNIHADTITSANIIGTTVNLIDANTLNTVEQTTSGGTVKKTNVQYTYEVCVQLDNNYVGYLDLSIAGSYYTNLNSVSTQTFDYRRKVFINGDTCKFNIELTTWFASDPLLRNAVSGTPSVTLNDSGVTLISELDSIDQIINILLDLYNSNDQVEGLLNNQLTQLQLIVQNTTLANQYLDTISKMKQWYFPFESLGIVANSLLNLTQNDAFNLNYWTYPIFTINQGQNAFTQWGDNGQVYYFVFITNTNINTVAQFQSQFTINDANITVERMQIVRSAWNLVKVTITKVGSSNLQITANQNIPIYIPLYFGQGKYLSTDFALNFGFSNSLLDDIHIIANGTTQSNQQAFDLSSVTDSMQQQMNSFTAQEDSYNQQMNNSINAIDFTSPVSQNAGILPAANFVISIFNGLIQNNAFSVLILIVCVLIIGKKVIGK